MSKKFITLKILKLCNSEFVITSSVQSIHARVHIKCVTLVAGETLRITVTAREYIDKLVDKGLVKIYAIANVKETKQTWSEEDDFQLQMPKLSIQVRMNRTSRGRDKFLGKETQHNICSSRSIIGLNKKGQRDGRGV
jgi:hypothetical protein